MQLVVLFVVLEFTVEHPLGIVIMAVKALTLSCFFALNRAGLGAGL